jgi:hypothetical protein
LKAEADEEEEIAAEYFPIIGISKEHNKKYIFNEI